MLSVINTAAMQYLKRRREFDDVAHSSSKVSRYDGRKSTPHSDSIKMKAQE